MTSRARALKIVPLIQEKKANDIVLFDLRKASPVSDFFLICTAQSPLHAQAIAGNVIMKMKQSGLPPDHIEGNDLGQWILLDFFDVVVHVFLADVREFYGLERLWGDMPQKRFEDT
jgi:ribosome-associated protein